MPKVPLNIVTQLVVKQHRHPLPLCANGKHDPSCKSMGREVVCTKVIKRYDKVNGKLEYEALCTHFWH
jgi:hypothetical protein